jgi:predicted permease
MMRRVARRVIGGWKTIFQRAALERDLDDELRATIETLADRFEEEGLSREEAARAALDALGGQQELVCTRENVKEGRIGAGLESFLLDARYAWRALMTARGVTAVIVTTLALAIAANTAIFSIVSALLIQPLPYRHPDRLAFIWLNRSDVGYPRGPLSGPDLRDLRQTNTTFEEIAAIWASGTVALTDHGAPEELRSAWVTTDFFRVLGAEAALGRTFEPRDATAPTILIGWDLFERRFGGDLSIVGRTILVSGVPSTIIGVMPKTFRLLLPQDSSVPDRLQVWRPFWPDVEDSPRGHLFMRVVGRMRPGVTIAQASADIDRVAHEISTHRRVTRAFTTVALQADAVRDVRGALLGLFAGVAILLAIACVNVASLLLARTSARSREIALRVALGASRTRLVRQSLIEGGLLMALGAAIGIVGGVVTLRVLVALAPESLSRIGTARVDGMVLAFTLALSLTWGFLFSLAPALALLRPSSAVRRMRARSALVVLQVAMSLVLLIGAGLLARAFVQLQRVDPGFRSDGRLTMKVALEESRYGSAKAVLAAMRALQGRFAQIPGVTRVSAISHLPFDDLPNWYLTYGLTRSRTDNGVAKADARSISTGLLETLGVTLVDGRDFTDAEPADSLTVIVDEMLAHDLWPGQRAVGRRFMLGQASPDREATVVGVVRHLRMRSLVENLTPQIFVPYASWLRDPMALVIASDREASELVPKAQAAIADVDPRLPLFDVRPLADYLDSARSTRRYTMLLASVFAVSALLLTCVGVYGVLAYSVTTRRVEIGVRRALGAEAVEVIGGVMREGLGFAALGSLLGLAVALVTGRLIEGQLYAVHALDPLTYACAVAVTLGGASLACIVPAVRALAINPLDVIRQGS